MQKYTNFLKNTTIFPLIFVKSVIFLANVDLFTVLTLISHYIPYIYKYSDSLKYVNF